MKMKTILLIMFIMIGILPYTAAATPGIYVTVDPLSQSAVSGNTIEYGVTVSNMDDGIPKLITSLDITSEQLGWTYTFYPLLAGMEIPGVEDAGINTVLSVTSPEDVDFGLYEHRINAEVEYMATYPLDPSDPFSLQIPVMVPSDPFDPFSLQIPLMLPEYDPEDFYTKIYDPTVPVPEFPTIALPVLSVIGLMLLFERKK